MRMEKSFVKGAAILGLAGLISKVLGAIYRIPYQNITGNEGMYVYQQVYPLFSTLLILATAGFPIAISKIVSERVALGDEAGARQVYRLSAISLFLTGFFFFAFLYLGAGQIAKWMGNEQMLTLPIQSVSFALLLVPMMAAIRGYFQGYQNMIPTAFSQVVEQFVRVCTIIVLAYYFIHTGYGPVYAGAGAVFGAFTGALAGLVVLIMFLYRHKRLHTYKVDSSRPSLPTKKVLKQIFVIALPICLGSLVLPLFQLVDSFTIANLLEQMNGQAIAIEQKGIYDRGQPLIQFASFFASAISLSIVPTIADLLIRKQQKEAEERANLAIRITWLVGLPASVGLAVIAVPANVMLFKDSSGSLALAILSFSALFSTLSITSAGILQGLGRLYLPVLFLFVGTVGKIVLNYLLIPSLGIEGAAIASVFSYALAAYLNIWACRNQFSQKGFDTGIIGKVGVSIILLAVTTKLVLMIMNEVTIQLFSYRIAMTICSLVTVLVGIIIYLWAILRFQVITDQDLEQMPKLKRKLDPLIQKYTLRGSRRDKH